MFNNFFLKMVPFFT